MYIPQRGLPGALPMYYQGISYFIALVTLVPDCPLEILEPMSVASAMPGVSPHPSNTAFYYFYVCLLISWH